MENDQTACKIGFQCSHQLAGFRVKHHERIIYSRRMFSQQTVPSGGSNVWKKMNPLK